MFETFNLGNRPSYVSVACGCFFLSADFLFLTHTCLKVRFPRRCPPFRSHLPLDIRNSNRTRRTSVDRGKAFLRRQPIRLLSQLHSKGQKQPSRPYAYHAERVETQSSNNSKESSYTQQIESVFIPKKHFHS